MTFGSQFGNYFTTGKGGVFEEAVVQVYAFEPGAALPWHIHPDAHEIASGITWLLVARDPERRWREAEAHFLYQINLYAQWFGEAGMQIAAVAKSRADLASRGAMIVSPEQAIEAIRGYAAAQPITRFYGWTLPPGLPPALTVSPEGPIVTPGRRGWTGTRQRLQGRDGCDTSRWP